MVITTVLFFFLFQIHTSSTQSNSESFQQKKDCPLNLYESTPDLMTFSIDLFAIKDEYKRIVVQICFRPSNETQKYNIPVYTYGSACIIENEYYFGINVPIAFLSGSIDISEYRMLISLFRQKFEIFDVSYDSQRYILEIKFWKSISLNGQYYCHIVLTELASSFSTTFGLSRVPLTISTNDEIVLTLRSKHDVYGLNDDIVVVCDYLNYVEKPSIKVSFVYYVRVILRKSARANGIHHVLHAKK